MTQNLWKLLYFPLLELNTKKIPLGQHIKLFVDKILFFSGVNNKACDLTLKNDF